MHRLKNYQHEVSVEVAEQMQFVNKERTREILKNEMERDPKAVADSMTFLLVARNFADDEAFVNKFDSIGGDGAFLRSQRGRFQLDAQNNIPPAPDQLP